MRSFWHSVAVMVTLAMVCEVAPAAEKEGVVVTQKYEKSMRGEIGDIPVLILRGTHRERGKAHGFLGAKEIVKTVDSMAVAIDFAGRESKKPVSWNSAAKLIGRFRYPERFVDELEGMLVGIEEALPDANDRTMKATQKPLTITDLKILQCGDVMELMLCSQFSAWGDMTKDGGTIIGRNWDYPPFFPFDTYCIFAIEPAEKGLQKTIDALWFGMLGAGFACLNEQSVYISADNGGEHQLNKIENPIPPPLPSEWRRKARPR